MQKKIIRREHQAEISQDLEKLHPLLRRVYSSRKITRLQELERNLTALLPFQSLLGINQATRILGDMVMQNKIIMIIGDFDADGATSSALAYRALKSFGAQQVYYMVPNRFAFGYGLTPELVEVAKKYKPDVLITVDNGIANHAGVLAAKEAGICVVVTDHHLPAATLPAADAIVNPNQPDDPFPSKNLAGVGVIFYVMLALRRHLAVLGWFQQRGVPEPNMSRLLDLVALGTVADLVTLDHNNRILVHQGLQRIRQGQCAPGIVALLELANRDFRTVTAADLGFAVASRLNAAGRLDDMSLGIECLISDDAFHAREMARTLNQLNQERRSIEQGMQAQALETLNRTTAQLNQDLPRGLCLFDEAWHQGVIGILASRIKDRFNRPVIVFAKGLENEIKGSARSIHGFHIRDTLALIDAQHPNLILKFGGHAMAAGLTIHQENYDKFAQLFNEQVSSQLSEEALAHYLMSDGEIGVDEFNLEVCALLRDGGPWGQNFPEPVFDDVFRILEQRVVGDKHLKLRLGKADKVLDAIAFFVDMTHWPNHRCDAVRAAYRLDINEYKERKNIQLIIEYLEPVLE